MDHMLAARLTTPQSFELVDVERPVPASNEVRIRVKGCGVCASSLPLWQGRSWFGYPVEAGAPGHEAWGIVDAVGADVLYPCVGMRVAALTYNSFAEFDVALANETIELPDDIWRAPFPGEALACAMNIYKRADISAGQHVAIIGIGFLGSLLTQLCVRAGATVIALSRRRFALDLAQRCGAQYTFPLEGDSVAAIQQITDNIGCERVIEAGGVQQTLDLASNLVSERGKLVIAGYHQDGSRQVNMQHWNWLGIDVVNAHERNPLVYMSGMKSAVEAVVSRELDLSMLITQRVDFGNLDAAFWNISQRPDGFVKAIVEC